MFANISGKRIFFDVVSEQFDASTYKMKKKPIFIIIHCASGFDHGYLRNDLDQLSVIGQVIYVDLHGSGRSEKSGIPDITFEGLADDIANFMQYLKIPECIIIGHCAGGFVAQHFAIRHPDRVKALILVNTAPSFQKIPNEDGSPLPKLSDRAQQDIVDIMMQVYVKGIVNEDNLKKYFEKVGPYWLHENHMSHFKIIFSYTCISLAMFDHFVNSIYRKYDVRDRLKEIKAKTLIIAGKQDWLMPASSSRFIAREIENATYVEFDNCCHFSFVENKVGFLNTIQDFIGETKFNF